MPKKFSDVRNIFQVLLAHAFSLLTQVREKALVIDAINAETKEKLQNLKLPFEALCISLSRSRECLEDVYLFGKESIKSIYDNTTTKTDEEINRQKFLIKRWQLSAEV